MPNPVPKRHEMILAPVDELVAEIQGRDPGQWVAGRIVVGAGGRLSQR